MTHTEQPDRKRRLVRTLISATVLVTVIVGGVVAWNHVSLQAPMQAAIDDDPRNAGIEVRVHYKHHLMPGTLVYDLREVGLDKAPIDVFRVFLQFAAEMKGEQFDNVELAFRGETKFILDGAAFRELGQDYGTQNPMYTVRTLPEQLRTPEGRPAFERWEGGALGVLGAQMNDFDEFQHRWYIDEL
jgi:hypothetical protein